MLRPLACWVLVVCSLADVSCKRLPAPVAKIPTPAPASASERQTIRCAVIGGLMDTGLWTELCQRFELATGHHVEVVARGPKGEILRDFIEGRADLITMHASDAMINLVADGYGEDPEPWARNDYLLVGPEGDPAGIRGMSDAGAAMRKIFETGNRFLIHASQGTQEVLHDLLESAQVELDSKLTITRLEDKHRQMLLVADQEQAYTLIGRIPFLNGKVPKQNLAIMVQGDPRLRRPYLVVTANPSRFPESRFAAARELARYLREPETQAWLAEYGRGQFDKEPLFFRVSVPGDGTR